MAPIAVTLDQQDPAVGVVRLIGEHDAYSATRLENELAVLLDAGLRIVIDLREATFVDSQTLSILLSTRHQAEEADLGFTLVLSDTDHTQVRRILEMTGLAVAFAIYPTHDSALAAARAGRTVGDGITIGSETSS